MKDRKKTNGLDIQQADTSQMQSLKAPNFSLSADGPAQLKENGGDKSQSNKKGSEMPSIKVKRKHINLTGEDKYGHWWTEFDGQSYGWWPKNRVGLKDTLLGTEGELNGVTSFGGSSTRDPHHGDSAEEELTVRSTEPGKTEKDVQQEMITFANNYSGEWRWTFGAGQNCHSFQKAMLKNSNLEVV